MKRILQRKKENKVFYILRIFEIMSAKYALQSNFIVIHNRTNDIFVRIKYLAISTIEFFYGYWIHQLVKKYYEKFRGKNEKYWKKNFYLRSLQIGKKICVKVHRTNIFIYLLFKFDICVPRHFWILSKLILKPFQYKIL